MALWIVPGCALRHSVDQLEAEKADLQRKNFELRKELAEARVRASLNAGARGTAVAPAPSEAGTAPRGTIPAEPAPADAAPQSPRPGGVVYSEPITDPAASMSAAGPLAGSSGAAELMRSARGRLDAKDADAALASFREIVARYPGDALADDAQFGAGECFFAQGRYELAIQEYRVVVDRFPFGDQVPFAFLKIGFAQLALERRDQALDSFRTVSQAYPGTEAATVARQQIAHMKAAP